MSDSQDISTAMNEPLNGPVAPESGPVCLVLDLADRQIDPTVTACVRRVDAASDTLDARLLATVLPDVVVAPLFAPNSDAVIVIGRLQSLGFGGRILILAPKLPNRRMVERELRSLTGGARLDLLEHL